MWVEQISKIDKRNEGLPPSQKKSLIENSLKWIKDIKKIELESIKDLKDREAIKKKLFDISIPYDGDIIEWAIKKALVPIVDTIMEKYDEFMNKWLWSIQDFFVENFSFIQDVFSNKLNIQDLKVRNFVDTVYSTWYSFEKKAWKYTIIDPKSSHTDQTIKDLNKSLKAINENKLVDNLDEVLVERWFTGQWLNIMEMVLILRTININPENEESMEKITPNDLAQAYLNYYSKILKYHPVPLLANKIAVAHFLKSTKGKIPNERITYIKLVQTGEIWTGIKNSTEDDTGVLRKMMKDFSKVLRETSWKISVVKEATSNVGEMLKNWLPGITKYMNWPEWLVLMGWLIYVLFFSDFKKTAWMSLMGFAWANVLTKAFNQDHNKWVLQVLWNSLENISKNKIVLSKALKPLENESWLKDNSNSKINTISIISKINFNDLMRNTTIKNWKVEIIDFWKIDWLDRKALKELWPVWNWKDKVNNLLTIFIDKSADKTWTASKTIEEQKEALEKKYIKEEFDDPSFSYVIADVLIWKLATSTAAASTSSTVPTTPAVPATGSTATPATPVSTPSAWPNLSILPTVAEISDYKAIASWITNDRARNHIFRLIDNGISTKDQLINGIKSVIASTPNASDKDKIKKLIKKIKK